MSTRYVLISPCRDESAHLQATIDTVAAQTLLPSRWVIVDDGSQDDTPRILAEAAAKYPYIQVTRRDDRGHRLVGPGVIDAFYHGLSRIRLADYDYVCKFDCDLELPPRYFERVLEYFAEDPWLGTLSGKLHLRRDGKLVPERTGDEDSVGPVKFYRRECFEDIGGFVRQVCWDGIDGHMCRMKGWIARSVDDPELSIVHLRQMGSSHISLWNGRKRWGRGKYFMGTAPYYAAAASLYRMFEQPYVVGGLGIFWGYLQATLEGAERMNDPEYLAFLRQFERAALFRGKQYSLERLHELIRSKPPKSIGTASGAGKA